MCAKKTFFWLVLLSLTVLSIMPVGLLPPQMFDVWDKAQHALGFAGLTLLGLWAYPRAWPLLPGWLLLHGGLIELVQAATGWRHGEWLDLVADALGIGAASALSWWMNRRRQGAS